MPAMPVTETSAALPSSAEAWNSSLISRRSRSRPTKGASRPEERWAPSAPATTRTALQSCSGSALPFSSWTPASSKTIVASVARRVVSPTSTEPGCAADWILEAVLTMSPRTMPSDSDPRVTAASPVSTPARAFRSGAPTSAPNASTAATSSSAARTARSASSSVATGEPHTAMTASPMNFSTTPP